MALTEILQKIRSSSPLDREILRRVMDAGIVVSGGKLTKAEADLAVQQARQSIANDLGVPIENLPKSLDVKEQA